MNIKQRIENEIKRNKNSKTINVNFEHEQIYKILKALKLETDIDFKQLSRDITKYMTGKIK